MSHENTKLKEDMIIEDGILYIVIYTIPNEIVWQFQDFLINHEIWSLNHETMS